MHSPQLANLLVVALSVFSVSQATFVEPIAYALNDDGLVKRQRGTSQPPVSESPTTTTPGVTTPTTPTTSDITTPTTPSTTTPTTTRSRTTSTTPTSTSTTSSTTSETPTTSSTTSSTPVSTITKVVTATNSDGSPTTFTSMSTQSAGLASQDTTGGSGGMSPQTRNTIIGVVVGVGGAVILAGIAFMAWRIWGRRRANDADDGMMNYGVGTGFSPVEKHDAASVSPATGRSPFQSTLESYHAPTQVNTASNF